MCPTATISSFMPSDTRSCRIILNTSATCSWMWRARLDTTGTDILFRDAVRQLSLHMVHKQNQLQKRRRSEKFDRHRMEVEHHAPTRILESVSQDRNIVYEEAPTFSHIHLRSESARKDRLGRSSNFDLSIEKKFKKKQRALSHSE